jgi:hypothetical protein
MPQGHFSWERQLAALLLVTAVALIAGTTTFLLLSDAERERCLARNSDRTVGQLQQVCGRPQ